MSASTKEQLKNDMIGFMKARQKPQLAVIRLINAAIKQYEVDQRVEADEQVVLQILTKLRKQRFESIHQFELAKREDLINQEKFELDLIANYLPQPMDEAQINQAIDEAIAEVKPQSIKDMGKVMAILKPKLANRADMAVVSKNIKQRLA